MPAPYPQQFLDRAGPAALDCGVQDGLAVLVGVESHVLRFLCAVVEAVDETLEILPLSSGGNLAQTAKRPENASQLIITNVFFEVS